MDYYGILGMIASDPYPNDKTHPKYSQAMFVGFSYLLATCKGGIEVLKQGW